MGESGVGKELVDQGEAQQPIIQVVGPEQGQIDIQEIDSPAGQAVAENPGPGQQTVEPTVKDGRDRHGGYQVQNHQPGMSGLDGRLGAIGHAAHAGLAIVTPEGPGPGAAIHADGPHRTMVRAEPAAVASIIGEKQLGQEKTTDQEVHGRNPGEKDHPDELVGQITGPPDLVPGQDGLQELGEDRPGPINDGLGARPLQAGMQGGPVGRHVQTQPAAEAISFEQKYQAEEKYGTAADARRVQTADFEAAPGGRDPGLGESDPGHMPGVFDHQPGSGKAVGRGHQADQGFRGILGEI